MNRPFIQIFVTKQGVKNHQQPEARRLNLKGREEIKPADAARFLHETNQRLK
jgi:hypothetical protein